MLYSCLIVMDNDQNLTNLVWKTNRMLSIIPSTLNLTRSINHENHLSILALELGQRNGLVFLITTFIMLVMFKCLFVIQNHLLITKQS